MTSCPVACESSESFALSIHERVKIWMDVLPVLGHMTAMLYVNPKFSLSRSLWVLCSSIDE